MEATGLSFAGFSFGLIYGCTAALGAPWALTAATCFAQTVLIADLFELSIRSISAIDRHIQSHENKFKPKLLRVATALKDPEKSPAELINLKYKKLELQRKLIYYREIFVSAGTITTIFTYTFTTPLVNHALTSIATSLPKTAIEFASSLSMSPLGLVITAIGIAALFSRANLDENEMRILMDFGFRACAIITVGKSLILFTYSSIPTAIPRLGCLI